jgi:radical SAM superfamily enzyme YgiQ (UPF0313 family)
VAQKVVLVNVNTCASPYPVFPLGLAHIAAALEAEGYEAHILDMALDAKTLPQQLQRLKPSYVGLSLRNIDDIQINNTHFYAPELEQATKQIRRATDAPIVLGGSGYSLFPDTLLKITGADFGIAGEGEQSFIALLKSLQTGARYQSIAGLVFHANGHIRINRKSACAAERIARPKFPQRLARHYVEKSAMLNIQTQRGCALKCSYCTYPLIEGKRFRRRSPESVCDDICAAQRAGANYVFIVDSVFNTSQEHVQAVCEEILRRNIRIKWGCFLRPKSITQPLMDLMARAGLSHIEFGSDSLCDTMLESYKKGFHVEDIVRASQCAQKAKVYYAHFLIIGGPSETEKTIRQSYANSKHIRRTVFFPFIGIRVYPHTPVYEFALKERVITEQTDLLPPYFYVSPKVSRKKTAHMISQFHAESHNWILEDISQQHTHVMRGLRNIGVLGPLWEFLIR